MQQGSAHGKIQHPPYRPIPHSDHWVGERVVLGVLDGRAGRAVAGAGVLAEAAVHVPVGALVPTCGVKLRI